jgi:uncharacterized membrane protein YcaP (DUF421 family)
METILRAAALYLILWLIMRVSGKRTLAQVTIFDFVLLLVISQAGQQALLGDDLSLTNALLIVVTLMGLHLVFTLAAYRWDAFDKFANDVPLVLIDDGQILDDRMRRSRVSEDDILEQARIAHGLERMDQIKYAVLERTGGISVVPRSGGG